MLTFEARGRKISEKIKSDTLSEVIDWIIVEFWKEQDMAIRKHILISVLKVMPQNTITDIAELFCSTSLQKDRDLRIVYEVYNWSLYS